MEEAAVRIGKSIGKLAREIKTWPVLGWVKDKVDAFKSGSPLPSQWLHSSNTYTYG